MASLAKINDRSSAGGYVLLLFLLGKRQLIVPQHRPFAFLFQFKISLCFKMKAVVLFVFLAAFALVQCYQDVHTSSIKRSLFSCFGLGARDTALRNVMKNGKPVTNAQLAISTDCIADMARTRVGGAGTVHYNFTTTACDVTVRQSDKMVSVKSKSEGPACGDLPTFQAVFLDYDPNGQTFMILDPGVAHWFFTRRLGGCDIFVAMSQGNRDRPIVIHSNLNRLGNDQPGNLRVKGEAVDEMLRAHPGFTVIARVYREAKPGDDRNQAEQELQRYRAAHNGVKFFGYDNWPPALLQNFQFIGHYDQMWNFILKGETNGQVTKITL